MHALEAHTQNPEKTGEARHPCTESIVRDSPAAAQSCTVGGWWCLEGEEHTQNLGMLASFRC